MDLKWIDGTADGITLNAPKGMALTDAGLYVADIDAVRLFDRVTGAQLENYPIGGAGFLNDVTTDDAGAVYVSDTSTGAVHAISPNGDVVDLLPPGGVQNPNGLAVWENAVYVTSGNGIYRIDGTSLSEAFSVPEGGLDGLVFLNGDTILVSSWRASAVYLVSTEGDAVEAAVDVASPADIGFDPLRGYLLIPLFNGNALDVRPLP
jgi:sugar lactone lactonase YvrE